jgi:hypothetical protein
MLLLLFVLSLAAYTNAQTAVADADCAKYRAFAAVQDNTLNSLSLAGAALTLTSDGQYTGNAALDAAGFKMVCGGSGQQLAFGAAFLSATANVNWTPSNNGNSAIFSVSASFCEIMLGLNQLFLYQDRDGTPGLQYTLGAQQFDCSVNNNLDCFVANSGIDLAKDLTYTTLVINKYSCNLPSTEGYNSNCTMWSISSTGKLGTVPVITVTLRIANQKIQWNGQSTGPDYSKLDKVITYPYTSKSQTQVGTNVAIAAYVGGKAGAAGIQGGTFQGKDALIFTADAEKAGVVAWNPTADLDGTSTDVVVVSISGQSVTDYNCQSCDLLSLWIITGWKLGVYIASLGGWTSGLVLISFPSIGQNGAPVTINYDPVVGMASQSDYSTNSGLFLMPSFLTMMACFVFSRFFSR